MSDVTLSKAVRTNLLSLQNTATLMENTQQRLATGKKVNSALDNPSNFFTASALNSRAADMSNLLGSMASGIKVIEAANNGITALTRNLESMQSTLRQARQDKSFQTQSFDVTEDTVITFGGGRFDLGSTIKLADAEAKQGTFASITSIGNTGYNGPESTPATIAGAGARAVISGLTGIAAGAEFAVDGVDIVAGTDTTAEGLAQTIRTELDANAAGKYRVFVGTGPNANSVIVESVDTSAAAAEVTFGTGTTEAVKGSVSFNFADLPAEITVGNQTIPAGTDYTAFVSALRAHAKEGEYAVHVDNDQKITLTATKFGVAAPTVTGVPEGSGPTAATTAFQVDFAATTTFSVAGQTVYMGGTPSTATYQIDITGTNPSTITIDGDEVTIPAAAPGDTAKQTADNAAAAINTYLTNRPGTPPPYTATVSETGQLVLTSDDIGPSTSPVVTSGTQSITAQSIGNPHVSGGLAPAHATATYQINLGANTPTTIKINGADVTIPAAGSTAPDSANAAQNAINAHLSAASLDYTAQVSDTGQVILISATEIDEAPPTITAGTTISAQSVGPAASTTVGTTGEQSVTTYTIDLTSNAASSIKIDGVDVALPAEAGDALAKANAAAGAINTYFSTNSLSFTAEISSGTLTITSTDPSAAAQPNITSGVTILAGSVTVDSSASTASSRDTYNHVIAPGANQRTAILVNGQEVIRPTFSADPIELAAQKAAFEQAVLDQIDPAINATVSYDVDTGALDIEIDEAATSPTIASGTQLVGKPITGKTVVALGTDPAASSATYNITLTGTAPSTISIGGTNVVIPAAISGDAVQTEANALAAIREVLTQATYDTTLSTTGELVIARLAIDSVPIPTVGNGQTIFAQTPTEVSVSNGSAGSPVVHEYQIALDRPDPSKLTVTRLHNGQMESIEIDIPGASDPQNLNADAAAAQSAIQAAIGDPITGDYLVEVTADGIVRITGQNAAAIGPSANMPTLSSGSTVIPAQTVGTGQSETGAVTTPETHTSVKANIEQALTDANVTGFTVSVNELGEVSITATTAGVKTALQVSGSGATGVDPKDGKAATTGAMTSPSVAGVSSEDVAAAKDTFMVSYDGKQADIAISGLDPDANTLDKVNWRAQTIESINAQLESQGIKGVEAKFDADGNLSLASKAAEAQTLAISGKDAFRLFGENTVSIGTPTETGLNAKKTTDKFVEFINKKFGENVRASNDSGRLRIENLSTQELSIGVDATGNGLVDPFKVNGNSVRANLAKQFNELRDQLDKLSDDASINGINLLRGDRLRITFNESGTSSIDIQSTDKSGNARGINAANLDIESLIAADLDTDEDIDGFLGKLASALSDLRSQASSFGSKLSSVQNRQDFTKSMIETLETGAANLTLADMNEEAANLLALQTRQSLSSSALSMASQADQNVLQLLR